MNISQIRCVDSICPALKVLDKHDTQSLVVFCSLPPLGKRQPQTWETWGGGNRHSAPKMVQNEVSRCIDVQRTGAGNAGLRGLLGLLTLSLTPQRIPRAPAAGYVGLALGKCSVHACDVVSQRITVCIEHRKWMGETSGGVVRRNLTSRGGGNGGLRVSWSTPLPPPLRPCHTIQPADFPVFFCPRITSISVPVDVTRYTLQHFSATGPFQLRWSRRRPLERCGLAPGPGQRARQ